MAETATDRRGGGTLREPNYASQVTQAKLREPSYASQGILSGCSREHAVVKANLGTCLSAATVLYLFRTAHELAAQPEAVGHGAFVIAGRPVVPKKPGKIAAPALLSNQVSCC
jgi:hypothetical protein